MVRHRFLLSLYPRGVRVVGESCGYRLALVASINLSISVGVKYSLVRRSAFGTLVGVTFRFSLPGANSLRCDLIGISPSIGNELTASFLISWQVGSDRFQAGAMSQRDGADGVERGRCVKGRCVTQVTSQN
jgi:hypothetical protein